MLFTYVKMATEIRACVREEIVSCKPMDLVSAAVQYESLDMVNEMLLGKIAALQKSLQSKENNLSEDEIAGIKKKIEKLEKEVEDNSDKMKLLEPRWEYVVTTISEASNEHIKNDLNAVRNLLRLTACQNNSKLYKYVVINGEDNEKLYEAMERIYQIDKREIDEEGRLCPSESIDKDYIFTKEVIGEIAKSLFSLPIETELTKKVNIKFNKTDLAYVHNLYVKSLYVRFTPKNENEIVYNGRVLRTLITKKKDKDGVVKYDFTAFYEVLSKLAIEYIVK